MLCKYIQNFSNSNMNMNYDWQVINDEDEMDKDPQMPLLVYVAREKRPFHPHHFKAGALNVLVI